MPRQLKFLALAVALPALLLTGVAGAAVAPTYDRIYLLGADTDYLYWSVDRFDPELGAASITRLCGNVEPWGIPGRSKPCLSGIQIVNGQPQRLHSVFFFPAALFAEKVTFSPSAPLKFHIEGTFDTAGVPYTVHLVVQTTGQIESMPATEVSPGVWEGSVTTGAVNANDVPLLYVRIRTLAAAATINLRLGGHTYLELPRPYAARSVPDLLREDTYAPEPTTFTSPTRSFTFNDTNWAVRSFTGETGPKRTFEFAIDQKSEILLAWVELYDTPFVHDVRRGRPPDRRKLQQGASLALFRDGEKLEFSGYGEGLAGYGTEALAVVDLKAGPLTLEVDSADESEGQRMPFTAYVLEVRGARTLRMMRWAFMQTDSFRVPDVAACPAALEPLPITDQVRTVAVDLDWDTEAIGLPAWTIRFDLPSGALPCSEGGTGDRLRLTMPMDGVGWIGATPAYDSTNVSYADTRFELQLLFTYSAPAA
jgi:hypothetical protein